MRKPRDLEQYTSPAKAAADLRRFAKALTSRGKADKGFVVKLRILMSLWSDRPRGGGGAVKRQQRIRTKLMPPVGSPVGTLWGWLDGRHTYLGIGSTDGACIGTLQGQKLYRLAKSIVQHFEVGVEL